MAKEIWDALAMKRALTRITYEIIEQNKGTDNPVSYTHLTLPTKLEV